MMQFSSGRTSRRVNQAPRKAYKPTVEENWNLYLQAQPPPQLQFQQMVMFHLKVAVMNLILMVLWF